MKMCVFLDVVCFLFAVFPGGWPACEESQTQERERWPLACACHSARASSIASARRLPPLPLTPSFHHHTCRGSRSCTQKPTATAPRTVRLVAVMRLPMRECGACGPPHTRLPPSQTARKRRPRAGGDPGAALLGVLLGAVAAATGAAARALARQRDDAKGETIGERVWLFCGTSVHTRVARGGERQGRGRAGRATQPSPVTDPLIFPPHTATAAAAAAELAATRSRLEAACTDLVAARAALDAAAGEVRVTRSQLELLRRELAHARAREAGEDALAVEGMEYEARTASWLARAPVATWAD